MDTKKNILIVEDDEVDLMTIKRAMEEIHIANPCNSASNGEEALEFLKNKNNPKPALILLDINMPKMNGLEFLKQVKSDEKLKLIPVVMLTTSRDDRDKFESFNNGVAGYMVKPINYLQFVETIRAINYYWILSETP